MNDKKRKYLRLEENTKKKQSQSFHMKGLFWTYLSEGRFIYGFKSLLVISIISAVVFFFVYLGITQLPIFSIMMGVLGFFFPYLVTSVSFTLSAKLKEAFAYKELVNVLESALKATNSTSEAMRMVADSITLAPYISVIMKDLVKDMTMGDSLSDAIERAKDKISNKHFKIALTIIDINHKIGSADTINALDKIQDSMDATIDNMQLFKDKLNTFLMEAIVFLAMSMALPFGLMKVLGEACAVFFAQWFADPLMALFVLIAIVGQLFMNVSIFKLAEEA